MKRRKGKKQRRNWLKLPDDVMANILYRVGVIDILENAQKVCTTWRSICKDPTMWKVIRMDNFWDPSARPPLQDMCKHAVDRSSQLVELSVVDFCDDELLMYIADRSSQLRRLEIAYCYGSVCNGWDECMEKFVKLEELSLHTTDITEEAIEVAGRCCPLLKTLKMNNQQAYTFVYDDTALAIGKNLPELEHLELIGNSLSNIGLQAILDGCGHLELLDLRQCSHIDLKGDLGKRCLKQIKFVKLPYDCLDDDSGGGVTIEPKIHIEEYDGGYYGYSDNDFWFLG